MEESYMKKIKDFIETCNLLDNGKVNVDYLKDDINNYSIDRTPSNIIVKQYTDGSTLNQITFDFSITAPIGSQSIVNLANSKFCEDFMEWIYQQNKSRNLPVIEGVQSIKCTSPGYVLQKTETTAIYIIQMNLIYKKAF